MSKKAEFWLAHVAAIRQEGVSTSAYAKRHGLSVKSLYGWQSKFNQRISAPTDQGAPRSFVALRVGDADVAQHGSECTVVLPSGVRLEMSSLPAPAWLVGLGRAIQGAP